MSQIVFASDIFFTNVLENTFFVAIIIILIWFSTRFYTKLMTSLF